MTDRYDRFAAFLLLSRSTGLFMRRKTEVSLSSSVPTAAELSLASVNWCGHFRIDVPSICLRV